MQNGLQPQPEVTQFSRLCASARRGQFLCIFQRLRDTSSQRHLSLQQEILGGPRLKDGDGRGVKFSQSLPSLEVMKR